MRCIPIFAAMLVMCAAVTSRADLIVTISPDVAGSIELGNSVTYSLNIATDAGTITNLGGIDFVINANDPGLAGSVTSGGQFVAGSSPFFPSGSGSYKLFFPGSVQIFGANTSIGQTVTTSPVTFATLTLSTLGATPGNYTLGFQLKPVLATDNSPFPAQAPTSFSYVIVNAVPEPTSVLFAFGAFTVGGVQWLRRSRHTKSKRLRRGARRAGNALQENEVATSILGDLT